MHKGNALLICSPAAPLPPSHAVVRTFSRRVRSGRRDGATARAYSSGLVLRHRTRDRCHSAKSSRSTTAVTDGLTHRHTAPNRRRTEGDGTDRTGPERPYGAGHSGRPGESHTRCTGARSITVPDPPGGRRPRPEPPPGAEPERVPVPLPGSHPERPHGGGVRGFETGTPRPRRPPAHGRPGNPAPQPHPSTGPRPAAPPRCGPRPGRSAPLQKPLRDGPPRRPPPAAHNRCGALDASPRTTPTTRPLRGLHRSDRRKRPVRGVAAGRSSRPLTTPAAPSARQLRTQDGRVREERSEGRATGRTGASGGIGKRGGTGPSAGLPRPSGTVGDRSRPTRSGGGAARVRPACPAGRAGKRVRSSRPGPPPAGNEAAVSPSPLNLCSGPTHATPIEPLPDSAGQAHGRAHGHTRGARKNGPRNHPDRGPPRTIPAVSRGAA